VQLTGRLAVEVGWLGMRVGNNFNIYEIKCVKFCIDFVMITN